jgi:threonine ammonia-lyase medium form
MVSLEEIKQARERIRKLANRTYLDHSATFSKIAGNQVYLKPENLQKTGAFKLRGAANCVLQLDREKVKGGVITSSSGNHGQAVAYAAAQAGFPAVVVLPGFASPAKAAAIKGYGAEIVYGDDLSTVRAQQTKEIAQERGMVFIHPFDDPRVIAGQGTIGLEIIEDLPDVDVVVAQIGGGGLLSGIAAAVKEQRPQTKVFGVEPVGGRSMYISRQAGRRTELKDINTIADGLKTNIPGELTFAMVERYVDDIFLVTDEEIKATAVTLLERAKLLAEPSGATALAAVLTGKLPVKDQKVAVVISGGNVNLPLMAELITELRE